MPSKKNKMTTTGKNEIEISAANIPAIIPKRYAIDTRKMVELINFKKGALIDAAINEGGS
ncbi:hypothetical protein ULMS_08740 [Patiriisocius marinistellae]|uniref:Uncharacterized protein n=2 Tax=Patiriisocius marinistellae TaxID=2494560 RepID=A0A5J4FYX7_9FLAO|nr:hypothetical protein ULMS_08740 [Patiriisocius marinistellae]